MRMLLNLIFLLPIILNAQDGIRFEEGLTWKQLLLKAKEENKYIFVDCYATWCGPCKIMDRSVYTNSKVGNYFNEKFISVKIQMDTSKFDNDFTKRWYGDASMIKNKYKVVAFPTYLFFSPNGDIVHRDVGSFRPEDFLVVGSDALNSDKQYYNLLERYRRNELNLAGMKELANKVFKVGEKEEAHRIANDYIDRLPIDSLYVKDNILLMRAFTNTSKDRGFIIFRDSCQRLIEIDEQVNAIMCKNIVLGIIYTEEILPFISVRSGKPDWRRIKSNIKKYGSLGEAAFNMYKPGIIFRTEIEPALENSSWDKILQLIKKQNLGKKAEFVVGSTVVYYLNAIGYYRTEKECKNLIAAATYYADSFPTFLRANTLNTWAWTVFEHSNEKGELRHALEWSKRSNELEPANPYFMDTYANILYRLGLVQEAIIWQKKAIQELKAKNYNNVAIQNNLEKMQKGENTWP